MLQVLGEFGKPDCVPVLLKLLDARRSEAVKLAALTAIQRFDQPRLGAQLVERLPAMSERLRSKAIDVLLSRKQWALRFLHAIDQGKLAAKDVPLEHLRVVALHQDKRLDSLVRKHWGSVQRGTPEEKLAEMRRLSNDLRAGPGNPVAGRELYKKHCAICHRFFDDGTRFSHGICPDCYQRVTVPQLKKLGIANPLPPQ